MIAWPEHQQLPVTVVESCSFFLNYVVWYEQGIPVPLSGVLSQPGYL